MTRDNTVRSMPMPGLGSKSRELAHREPTLSQPNWFQVNRRLKEIETQQQRTEEMLATIFLNLEDIRVAVGATGEEPRGEYGFRLPNARSQAAAVSLPWWMRLWYSFVAPWKLRRPDASRWSDPEPAHAEVETVTEGEPPAEVDTVTWSEADALIEAAPEVDGPEVDSPEGATIPEATAEEDSEAPASPVQPEDRNR